MLTIASMAGGALADAVLAFLGPLGWQEIIVILIIVLILFGGRKIPELARGIGRGLREFKREVQGARQDFDEAVRTAESEEPPPEPPRPKKKPSPAPPAETAESKSDKANEG